MIKMKYSTSWSLIFLIAVHWGEPGRMARAQKLSAAEEKLLKENGTCVDWTKEEKKFASLCTFEVDRGVRMPQDPIETKNLLEVCVLFEGFQQGEAQKCSKIYCFDLKGLPIFWALVIVIPLSIIVVIIAICCLCGKCVSLLMSPFRPGKKGNNVPVSNEDKPAPSTTASVESNADPSKGPEGSQVNTQSDEKKD